MKHKTRYIIHSFIISLFSVISDFWTLYINFNYFFLIRQGHFRWKFIHCIMEPLVLFWLMRKLLVYVMWNSQWAELSCGQILRSVLFRWCCLSFSCINHREKENLGSKVWASLCTSWQRNLFIHYLLCWGGFSIDLSFSSPEPDGAMKHRYRISSKTLRGRQDNLIIPHHHKHSCCSSSWAPELCCHSLFLLLPFFFALELDNGQL